MLGVRLDKETEEKLDRLARETHRSKSYYVKEAIAEYLAEKEDTFLALARLEKAETPMETEQVWRALGWEAPSGAKDAGATRRAATRRRPAKTRK
jgi:RHH-type rel operon transcriptional repressor/antitoxin RelB